MYYFPLPPPFKITIHSWEDKKIFNSFSLQMRNLNPKMLNDILKVTMQAEGRVVSRSHRLSSLP